MTVKVEWEDRTDPASNVWFTALAGERAELGAHIPANARRSDAILSVFWCGDTSRTRFRNAVERTEKFFLRNGGYVEGTLSAYGLWKAIEGPITRKANATDQSSSDPGLGVYLTEVNPLGWCSAYRAEFQGTGGKLILWANVVDADTGKLEEEGDNIGICTSPALFDGAARTLFVETIEETRQGTRPATRVLSHETVGRLLGEISEKVESVGPNLKK
jgi:hypothetical protein